GQGLGAAGGNNHAESVEGATRYRRALVPEAFHRARQFRHFPVGQACFEGDGAPGPGAHDQVGMDPKATQLLKRPYAVTRTGGTSDRHHDAWSPDSWAKGSMHWSFGAGLATTTLRSRHLAIVFHLPVSPSHRSGD